MKANNPQSMNEKLSALADDELDNIDADEVCGLACHDINARYAWQSAHLLRDVLQSDYHTALSPNFSLKVSAAIALEQTYSAEDYAAPVVSIDQARNKARDGREQRIRGAQPARRATRNQASGAVQSMQQQPFVLWKPIAGLGLAASLAGATFLFPQLWQAEGSDAGQLAQGQLAQVEQTAVNTVASTEVDQNINQNIDGLTLQAAVRIGNGGTRWRMDTEVPRNEEVERRLNTLLTNHLENASMGGVHGLVSHSRVVGYDSVQSEQSAGEQ